MTERLFGKRLLRKVVRARPSEAAVLSVVLMAGCARVAAPPEPEPVIDLPATVSANAAPVIEGDELCVGPVGRTHVYPLRLIDPEGEPLTWSAVALEARGEVYPRAGAAGSGTTVEVVYEPPSDRADENVIVVTATDPRGASVTKRLIARSG